ncbi:MAG: hypothetical protein D6705_12830 [Deltaproteobacteria bacterium]|nr:MAG: hypothetical protein D6705_12830 [Deltaproteobacteria bacterium]
MNGAGREDCGLDPFVRALARDLDARIERAEAGGDVLAAVERARELNGEAVSSAFVDDVRSLADVVPLRAARPESAHLVPFVEAARRDIEGALSERALSPVGRPRSRPSNRRARGGGPLRRLAPPWAAAAAVVLLLTAGAFAAGRIFAPAAPEPNVLAVRRAPAPTPSRARHGTPPGDEDRPRAVAPKDAGGAPSVGVEDRSGVSGGPGEPAEESKRHGASPAASADDLAELDRRARAAWARGDRTTAERLFRRIVERGGHGRTAELAFGELFVLAEQRGASVARRRAYFRRYLARFPHGRFAADARAGLCRLAADPAEARACWRRYLTRHPSGAHAAQARRVLEEQERDR